MMACVAGGESMRALDILERVKRSKGGINSGPDMLTYTSAITACASEGKPNMYRFNRIELGVTCLPLITSLRPSWFPVLRWIK